MTGLTIAIRMLEKIGPTTKSTLSRSTSSLALFTATSGFCSSSTTTISVSNAAQLLAQLLDREQEAVARPARRARPPAPTVSSSRRSSACRQPRLPDPPRSGPWPPSAAPSVCQASSYPSRPQLPSLEILRRAEFCSKNRPLNRIFRPPAIFRRARDVSSAVGGAIVRSPAIMGRYCADIPWRMASRRNGGIIARLARPTPRASWNGSSPEISVRLSRSAAKVRARTSPRRARS